MAIQQPTQLPLLADVDMFQEITSLPGVRRRKSAHVKLLPQSVHIARLIVHEVDHWSSRVQLAEIAATFTPDTERFIAGHILAAMSDGLWEARFQEADGEVPKLCQDLLGTEDEFIAASRELAMLLFKAMTTRSIALGDFVAVIYTIDDQPTRFAALLKLDRVKRHVRNFRQREGGRLGVDVSEADNIFSDDRRLTKCALISVDSESSRNALPGEALTVQLLDAQAGPHARSEVAIFFFDTFLKTQLVSTARWNTHELIRSSDKFITKHESYLAPAELETFYQARRTMLNTASTADQGNQQAGEPNERLFNIEAFASAALPTRPDLREQFLDQLKKAVPPTILPEHLASEEHQQASYIAVDSVAARPYVQKITYELDGGWKLLGPANRRNDIISIDPQRTPDGKTIITIKTQIFKEAADRSIRESPQLKDFSR